MSAAFDVRTIRLQSALVTKVDTAASKTPIEQRPAPRRAQEPFINRIPLPWAHAMARLPGRASVVGLALWYRSGVMKGDRTVVLSSKNLRGFGLTRNTARRALRDLEKAGLVSVERHSGRAPRVTLLEPPAPPGERADATAGAPVTQTLAWVSLG